ncbi:hypothetical protein [Microbacterium sp. MMO-10]|uniref:hypothetical protein n=1 Tax=Microbacterium sp. MMO-10 TaxID=3081272 RepID=UPI0030168EA3
MGYVLEGGPRNGDYSDDLPLGYAAKQIVAGVVSSPNDSPAPKAEWLGVNDAEFFRSLPNHELTMSYDIARKIAADWHEPDLGRKAIAANDERLARNEMKRRGIFDGHQPR